MAGRIRATTTITITTMTTATAMFMTTDPSRIDRTALLFAWFSPAFPTGGFAYSHGLETAAAEGGIMGEAGLGDWLADVLEKGAGWTDAVVFALAYRAESASRLLEVAALSAALAPSKERLAESLGQGQAFLAAVREGWPGSAPEALPARTTYPAAAGAGCAAIGAPLQAALGVYLTGFAANLIAAGVRLGLCGQSGGVRLLARLQPLIARLAAEAAVADEDDLGACAFGSDVASMRHETLEGRLFLS
jgi:urease accessory protein